MNVIGHKTDLSTEKLIQAVKKRPGLYSRDKASYHLHGKYKGKLWKEVCHEVFPDWNSLSRLKRVEYAHDLQKRWKNIRTCFTRELLHQRKELELIESGSKNQDYKRRRKYMYFDMLTFLVNPEEIPVIPDTPEVKVLAEEDSNDPLESDMFQMESEDSVYEESASRGFSAQHYVEIEEDPQQTSAFQRDENIKQEVLQILGDNMKKNETEDEDRQFALSIVPALRRLNDKQKFDAKIEILKVLKKISTEEDS